MRKIKEITEWATAFKTHSDLLIFVKRAIIHLYPAGFSTVFSMSSWTHTTRPPSSSNPSEYLTFSYRIPKCPLPKWMCMIKLKHFIGLVFWKSWAQNSFVALILYN